MNTPIADFVRKFQQKEPARFHMPGHKGKQYLGIEAYDITEIRGADSLYEAEGIIAKSEENASLLFGSGKTFYSAEGSSHCIKAMIFLLLQSYRETKRPYIIAARNAHKSFLYGAALLDLDIVWIYGKERTSLCSCQFTTEQFLEDLERIILGRGYPPVGVYLTTPDYLGNLTDLGSISEICHKKNLLLAVDNAHGAYLHFLKEPIHPMDLGVDFCCDSAHKTLSVLTGGAYLHIAKKQNGLPEKKVRQALSLFGSTSPSYLILQSLDLCNRYLWQGYQQRLDEVISIIEEVKKSFLKEGLRVKETEPLKMTIYFSYQEENGAYYGGTWLAEELEKAGIYCEYADPEYIVFMFTPENTKEEITFLKKEVLKLSDIRKKAREKGIFQKQRTGEAVSRMSVRQAVFSEQEEIPVCEAVGRICALPTVSCPPAIPVVVSGEVIRREDIPVFSFYGIRKINVVVEKMLEEKPALN